MGLSWLALVRVGMKGIRSFRASATAAEDTGAGRETAGCPVFHRIRNEIRQGCESTGSGGRRYYLHPRASPNGPSSVVG